MCTYVRLFGYKIREVEEEEEVTESCTCKKGTKIHKQRQNTYLKDAPTHLPPQMLTYPSSQIGLIVTDHALPDGERRQFILLNGNGKRLSRRGTSQVVYRVDGISNFITSTRNFH